MCEYCDGKFREGRDAIVWPDDLTLKWKLILRDYEKNISMVCFIKFCPFCGRRLADEKEGG